MSPPQCPEAKFIRHQFSESWWTERPFWAYHNLMGVGEQPTKTGPWWDSFHRMLANHQKDISLHIWNTVQQRQQLVEEDSLKVSILLIPKLKPFAGPSKGSSGVI